jgi:hypothetical protein
VERQRSGRAAPAPAAPGPQERDLAYNFSHSEA